MNEEVREWVVKAEGDFVTANREFVADAAPNYDAVCFHSQQCIEKLMKALLVANGVIPPKIHDLIALDALIGPLHPGLRFSTADLARLSRAAVTFRYPGESATQEIAVVVLGICSRFREALLKLPELSE